MAILKLVPRRLPQLVAALVLVLAAFTPLVECFDHWDGKTTVPANDTELRLTVFFVGAGALLTLGQLVRHAPMLAGRRFRLRMPARVRVPSCEAVAEGPTPSASPPPIPLRI